MASKPTKDLNEACLRSSSCHSGFCSPTSGRCEKPSLFQRCNAKAEGDPCPFNQVCDKDTFRCLPLTHPPKNKGGIGAQCKDMSECGAKMTCRSGTCAYTGEAGSPCDESPSSKSGPQCKDGTVCFNGTCRDTCYTISGKDNPNWKCANSEFKCLATGRGIQGVCALEVPGPKPPQVPVEPTPKPSPQPVPIIVPGPSQTPTSTPEPTKVEPWYKDRDVQLWCGAGAMLVFALILVISITVCCVRCQRKKKQRSKDVEGKNPSIPLENTNIVASAPITTPHHGVMHGSTGIMVAPAMGPELPPSYHDIASTSASPQMRMPSSASLGSEKSGEKQGASSWHQSVPTAPESEEDTAQGTASLHVPRTPTRPPGSF